MISEEKKVSIVLPTCNGEKYLRQSLESVLKQTYRNIEVIIVDDGSTDTTPQIIQSCGDNRIKSIRHDQNRGLPHSLNRGFAAATGDYLTWTSDDNYFAETALEKLLSFLKASNCCFVYSDYYVFDNGNPSALKTMRLPDMPALNVQNNIGPCFLYSRRVKERTGDYDPDTRLAEDYDYWLRVEKKFTMCHLPEPLYFYRLHATSLTSLFSREYEIKVVDTLVRLKNNCISIGDATEVCMKHIKKNIESKYRNTTGAGRCYRLLELKRKSLIQWHTAVVRFRSAKQIHNTLLNFTKKRLNFGDAKAVLIKTINGKS
jgi:glycosyltransferase involved in cell wall biosynthesis